MARLVSPPKNLEKSKVIEDCAKGGITAVEEPYTPGEQTLQSPVDGSRIVHEASGLGRSVAAGYSSSAATQLAKASVPRCMYRCTAARLRQPPQAINIPWLTPLLASLDAQVCRQV